jgi:hypothetical protein
MYKKGFPLPTRFMVVFILCQGHKESQKQRLNERSKSNFQTRNKIKYLIQSFFDVKTQELRIKTQDVQNKRENKSLLC